MLKLFLTYAWRDNEDSKIDYLVRVLKEEGIEVQIDRWTIPGGTRLWDKIDKAIADPALNGWAIFATRASLQSEACREELAYALDRALSVRGKGFPLIGIFPEPLERQEIPSAIRVRRYVQLSDPMWARVIASALSGAAPQADHSDVVPFVFTWHSPTNSGQHVVEIRPKIDFWYPAIFLVPASEAEGIQMNIIPGPPGHPPGAGMTSMSETTYTDSAQREWKGQILSHQIGPNLSIYAWLKPRPSRIMFGPKSGMHYIVPPF